jgi:hypothetical protein
LTATELRLPVADSNFHSKRVKAANKDAPMSLGEGDGVFLPAVQELSVTILH